MALDLSSEAIGETDMELFCVEMMKRLDFQRRNEHFCDVILEVGSGEGHSIFPFNIHTPPMEEIF